MLCVCLSLKKVVCMRDVHAVYVSAYINEWIHAKHHFCSCIRLHSYKTSQNHDVHTHLTTAMHAHNHPLLDKRLDILSSANVCPLTRTRPHIHARTHSHTHMPTHTRTCPHMQAHAHSHTHMPTHTRTCPLTHAHAHTYTHAYADAKPKISMLVAVVNKDLLAEAIRIRESKQHTQALVRLAQLVSAICKELLASLEKLTGQLLALVRRCVCVCVCV
jgi:hypothetical protein